MQYKCVWNIGREEVLTLDKIYSGYPYNVAGNTGTFIRIEVCDDGNYGIFAPDRFEWLEEESENVK